MSNLSDDGRAMLTPGATHNPHREAYKPACLGAYGSAGIPAHCRNSFSDNHSALTEGRCNHKLTIEYEVVKRGLGDESDRASS